MTQVQDLDILPRIQRLELDIFGYPDIQLMNSHILPKIQGDILVGLSSLLFVVVLWNRAHLLVVDQLWMDQLWMDQLWVDQLWMDQLWVDRL